MPDEILELAKQYAPPFGELADEINVPEPAKRRRWTVNDLLTTDFPEPKWSIPGIFPEGLSILGGRPKVGKSWLMLQAAISIATGEKFFDRQIEKGEVLYLAMEDKPRRLKERLLRMGVTNSDNMSFEFDWKPLQAGGLHELQMEIDQGQWRLVVIDTLSRAIPGIDQDRADKLNPILFTLQNLALNKNMAIILLDHTRKPNGMISDPIDDIQNNTCKSGTADTIFTLQRTNGVEGAILAGRGRDIEDVSLKLSWNTNLYKWECLGDSFEVELSESKRKIIEAIELIGKNPASKIAEHLGANRGNTCTRLAELVREGRLSCEAIAGTSYYSIPEPVDY